jgi:hypothetical protein
MPRGKLSDVGDTRVAGNGYHYTKTEDCWRLTHHLTAEKILGRPLKDSESVRFKEPKYKRDPTNESGIVIVEKRTSSLRRRKHYLQAQIARHLDEIHDINVKLGLEDDEV